MLRSVRHHHTDPIYQTVSKRDFSEVARISPVLFSWPVQGVWRNLCLAVTYMFLAFKNKEVRVVGVLVRWLFRLLLFRVLVGLWRIFRRS
jgi:hypothetical protein